MAAKKKSARSSDRLTKASMKQSLTRAGNRLGDAKHARDGDIAFHLSGTGGGKFVVNRSGSKVTVREESALGGPAPKLEVYGSASKVNGILEGKLDAREEFLKGGLRVRGDIGYLSDIGVELGILDHPL